MQEQLWIEFINLLKIILLSPIAGWMLTICLFEIMQKVFLYQFPKGTLKKRKKQCWIYLSFVVVIIALLLKAFA